MLGEQRDGLFAVGGRVLGIPLRMSPWKPLGDLNFLDAVFFILLTVGVVTLTEPDKTEGTPLGI